MTIESPALYMQAGTYPARLDRFQIDAVYEEGVLGPLDCKVSQKGTGANFSVDVAVGSFIIQGDDQALQGKYLGRITATENVVVTAAPGSNSRYDIVTLRVNDPNAGGNAGSTVTVVVVAGTVAASPAVPATPASSLLLAVIGPISSSTASITNSIITESRRVAGLKAPVGTLNPFASTQTTVNIPNGWAYCDGSAVSRTTFANLFAAIGTSYGTGDGSTTFNLPDLRQRVPVASGSGFPTIGATGGEITHALTMAEMPVHNHAITDPGHGHVQQGTFAVISRDGTQTPVYSNHQVGTGFSVADWENGSGGSAASNAAAVTISGSTQGSFTGIAVNNAGSGNTHNNMPPYQVITGYVIKF